MFRSNSILYILFYSILFYSGPLHSMRSTLAYSVLLSCSILFCFACLPISSSTHQHPPIHPSIHLPLSFRLSILFLHVLAIFPARSLIIQFLHLCWPLPADDSQKSWHEMLSIVFLFECRGSRDSFWSRTFSLCTSCAYCRGRGWLRVARQRLE